MLCKQVMLYIHIHCHYQSTNKVMLLMLHNTIFMLWRCIMGELKVCMGGRKKAMSSIPPVHSFIHEGAQLTIWTLWLLSIVCSRSVNQMHQVKIWKPFGCVSFWVFSRCKNTMFVSSLFSRAKQEKSLRRNIIFNLSIKSKVYICFNNDKWSFLNIYRALILLGMV